MPHLYIEYTQNIKSEADIPKLLQKLNQALLFYRDMIPVGGIRIRAIELTDYLVADGTKDDAFVHVTLKLGKGRTEEDKKMMCDHLFKTIEEHFASLYEKRYLALSMELYEYQTPTWKRNNIHIRYKR
ncbi:MAG TPA: 5-carboxymethyl-2-hydroxymuconate Delta-isomerase [Virgibacillus sp.]|nr:5-carboxymethyl-2-hydroxymuconate Delta-isomerase [Virgibacillus sp.]